MLAQVAEVGRVAEQLAHLHGEGVQQRGFVLHPVLELGQGGAVEVPGGLGQPAFEGGLRVAAEVMVVLQVERLEQQPQLDVELLRRHVEHARPHPLGIQTRRSDSSFSTSSGLAMESLAPAWRHFS